MRSCRRPHIAGLLPVGSTRVLPDHEEDADEQQDGGDPVRVVNFEGGKPRCAPAAFVDRSSSKVRTVQKTMKNTKTAASTQKSVMRWRIHHSTSVTAATTSVPRAQMYQSRRRRRG